MSTQSEFRLEAFVADHADRFAMLYLLHLQHQVESGISLDDDDGTAMTLLTLVYESEDWLEIGQATGFFSPGAEYRRSVEIFEGLEGRTRAQSYSDAKLIPLAEFSSAIDQAMDDLTDDRLEHLRLLLFAPDREWQLRIARLETIVDLFASNREIRLPPAVVDDIEWALSGAETDVRSVRLPCAWRTADSLASTDRGQELAEVHARLRGIAARVGITDVEHVADAHPTQKHVPSAFGEWSGTSFAPPIVDKEILTKAPLLAAAEPAARPDDDDGSGRRYRI